MLQSLTAVYRMISFSRVRYSQASSGEEMSGSLTISISGTPERLRSIEVHWLLSGRPSCRLLPASSSMCTRVMPMRLVPPAVGISM